MSVFTGTLPNSPPRNPPPLPKRATCYLKDSSPSVSGQPIPPFPPPAFMPPAVPAMVSKEPEPLDIVIGKYQVSLHYLTAWRDFGQYWFDIVMAFEYNFLV